MQIRFLLWNSAFELSGAINVKYTLTLEDFVPKGKKKKKRHEENHIDCFILIIFLNSNVFGKSG